MTAGTIMHRSHLPLKTWFMAVGSPPTGCCLVHTVKMDIGEIRTIKQYREYRREELEPWTLPSTVCSTETYTTSNMQPPSWNLSFDDMGWITMRKVLYAPTREHRHVEAFLGDVRHQNKWDC